MDFTRSIPNHTFVSIRGTLWCDPQVMVTSNETAIAFETLWQQRSVVYSFPLDSLTVSAGRQGMAMPFWFPVLLTAFGATVTLIPWSRRFSLRTLLIATTLIAFVLGAVIYSIQ
jgi:hypothetical protein